MNNDASRHVVIGTAGHVDHGKTALVKVLTGTDTDRWEEEKRRGITIDIGFAELDLGDGVTASIVDVPGHEDFVRNMVAGATGIDVAMLVIAADEGVMPQTEEHLAILEFLGVRVGVVVLTKTDLVEADWLELVIDDVTERLSRSSVQWRPPVPVSAVEGDGLDELRSTLHDVVRGVGQRDSEDLFRMPVDRVFSVAGAGTVVTGTVWAGTVGNGDTVRLLPHDREARVRSIEVHGKSAPQAVPGRRTALALVGLDRDAAPRGSMVVTGAEWRPTQRIDAHVTLLPNARPLTQRSRIRFHLGTAEVMARVTPAADVVEPGGQGVVRLRLELPMVCRWGDRGVIRAYSPVTTVGGCVVLDPLPDPRPRRPSPDPRRMSADPAERVVALVESRAGHGLDARQLEIRAGIPASAIASVLDGLKGVARQGDTLWMRELASQTCDRMLEEVRAVHDREPSKPGLSIEVFRARCGNPAMSEYVRRRFEETGQAVFSQGYVRLADHIPTLEGPDKELGDRLLAALEQAGGQGASLEELGQLIPNGRASLIAEFFVSQNTVVRIGADRYLHRDAADELTRLTVAHLQKTGEASPADLRETLGLTRKYLIPVLGWLDGQGVTVRSGDVRRLGPKAHPE